jgi:hypothetical protein
MALLGTNFSPARCALALTLATWMCACGSDSSASSEAGTTGGTSAGTSAAGTSAAGTGGAGTGAAGTAATGDSGIPMTMCDPTIATTATCGGTMCPASTSPIAAFTCSVPCCTASDECGLRSAVMDAATECAGPAQEDPSCPGYTGMAMGTQVDLPGCCAAGVCGAISTISMTCITSSMFLPDLAPGGPCGDDVDAGM